MKKYELTKVSKRLRDGTVVWKIKYTKEFSHTKIKPSRFGGWIEHEGNFDQTGTCWIDEDVIIRDCARVEGEDVDVTGNVLIKDNAVVGGSGSVSTPPKEKRWLVIGGDSKILGFSWITASGSIAGKTTIIEAHLDNLTERVDFRDVEIKQVSDGPYTSVDSSLESLTIPKTKLYQIGNQIVFRFSCKNSTAKKYGSALPAKADYFQVSGDLEDSLFMILKAKEIDLTEDRDHNDEWIPI